MNTRILRRGLIPAALLGALAACGDQPAGPRADASAASADLAALRRLGFATDAVRDAGDAYVVEGDIEIAKADLRAGRVAAPATFPSGRFAGTAMATVNLPAPRLQGPGGPRFQAYTNTLVSASRVRNIKVDLSGLSAYPAWQTAARSALSYWTGITGSAVVMSEGSPADIAVTVQNLNSTSTIAQATWPKDATGGGPGPTIKVNSQNISISDSWKVFTMVHELGHTIGLRHTNWSANGESAGTLGANFVQGTSSSDASSVMNSVVQNWAGFTAYDERAAITLYGDTTQLSVSYTANGPLVSWSAISGATSYELNVLYVGYENYNDPYDPNNSYGSTVYEGQAVGTTTGTSYLDTTNSYTGVSSCSHAAFPSDPNWSGGTYTSYYWLKANFANGETHSHVVAQICHY